MIEAIVMILFAALCLVLLEREGVLKNPLYFISAVLFMVFAFGLRYLCLPHETLDYQNFLTKWVDFFRVNGGFAGLQYSVGNYNIPYLYFLAAFSYFSYPDLYLIKYLSIGFDIVLAWYVMKTVAHFSGSPMKKLLSFCVTLLLPTVILNGSYWGQCDCIFVAFGIGSIYYALSDKPYRSLIFITLSFAFKLQAVFFMPVFFVLLVKGRIRWRQLWIVPVTYLLCVLPAVLAGRPLWDTITLYFNQAGTVGSGLNYNSSSVFALIRTDLYDSEMLSKFGIAAAFLFCAILLAVMCFKSGRKNDRAILAAFVLTAICVPFLLPHMHDRYFFAADILSLILAFTDRRAVASPFCVSFASLLGYHAYLRMRYLLPMRYGAIALIFAIVNVSGLFYIYLLKNKKSLNN